MNMQIEGWRGAADALWGARPFDYPAAARLVAEIAGKSEDPDLIEAARQALPSLRHAASREAETFRRAIAKRRFGAVREALHRIGRPSFGRRAAFAAGIGSPEGTGPLPDAAELRRRAALGLPARGPLAAPDIQAAYRRAAKAIHPDRGGTTDAFVHLVAARDALLRRD